MKKRAELTVDGKRRIIHPPLSNPVPSLHARTHARIDSILPHSSILVPSVSLFHRTAIDHLSGMDTCGDDLTGLRDEIDGSVCAVMPDST